MYVMISTEYMIIFNITNYHSNRHNLLKPFNHNLNTVFLKELGHCIQGCHLSLRFFQRIYRAFSLWSVFDTLTIVTSMGNDKYATNCFFFFKEIRSSFNQ